jgi:DNA invertase Pin-like site-specific DNA recombinase
MRRAVVYLRVSTIDQTTANQERELREIAGIQVYPKDLLDASGAS